MSAGRPRNNRRFSQEELVRYVEQHQGEPYHIVAKQFGCGSYDVKKAHIQVFGEDHPRPAGVRNRQLRDKAIQLFSQDPCPDLGEVAEQIDRTTHWIRQNVPAKYWGRQVRTSYQRRGQAIIYARMNPQAPLKEIAEHCHMTVGSVCRYLTQAGMGSGRGKPRGGRRVRRDINSLLDPNSKRVEILRDSILNDWTLSETGEKLGLTRERVRQLLQTFHEYYPGYQQPTMLRLRDIAPQWNLSYYTVRRIAEANGIGRVRGESTYVLRQEEIEPLRQAVMQAMSKPCAMCGTNFNTLHGWRKYCSEKCQAAKAAYRNSIEYRNNPVAMEKSRQWGPLKKLLDRTPVEHGEWVSLTDATRISGLSRMQAVWLRYRGVLSTRPSQTRMWRGKPTHMYSVAELRVVRQYLQRIKDARVRARSV